MSAAEILRLGRQLGFRIGTAESCTGGLIAAALSDLPGSSDVFEGGFVTYSNAAKIASLGVKVNTLTRYGAVSEEVAREMADGARQALDLDLALSVTGIAGPGGSELKPEGRVCFGLSGRRTVIRSETIEFGALGRANVREAARNHGLSMICEALKTQAP